MTTPHDYWLEQPAATATPSLADLRRRDAEVQRVTLRRNILELVAGGIASLVLLVICGLALQHAGEPAELVRALGFAALPLGLFVSAAWFLISGRTAPDDLAETSLDHLTRRLRREHRLLRLAWLWYVAPMLPGFAMVYGGTFAAEPDSGLFVLVAAGLTAAFLTWVVLLNRRAAMHVADELGRLERARPMSG